MRVLVTKFQKVERVAFAPEGTHLFASGLHFNSLGFGDSDSGIDVFDLAAGSESVARLFAGQFVIWFAPLANWRLAVARQAAPTETTLGVTDWRSGREDVAALDDWRVWHTLASAPGGGRLFAGILRVNLVRGGPTAGRGVGCWAVSDTVRPDWHTEFKHDRHLYALAIDPDERALWSAEWVSPGTSPRWRMELVPRDAATGKPIRAPIAYPNQKISGLALNGTHAVAHDGPTLFVYDRADLDRKPKKLTNPAKRKHFGGFALHPSGRWLATAGLDGAVTLWDTATWAIARTWVWDAGQARSVCFSADGTLAAAGTDSGKVVVWDLDV